MKEKCLIKYRNKFVLNINTERNEEEYFRSLQPKQEKKDKRNILRDSFNQGYYERFFIEIKKLGRGNRGSVFLCQHILNGIKLGFYAIKKIPVGDDKERLETLLKEVLNLERISDKNVVDYKHSWIELHKPTKFGPLVPCLFILMEVANGGNLTELIDSGVKLTEEEILNISEQILSGLLCLHSNRLVHKDIKPENILLHFETSLSIPRVIITDFDTCEEDKKLGTEIGTIDFCSPEIVKNSFETKQKKLSSEILRKSDLWSVGMVIYYLNYHTLPYQNINDFDLLKTEIASLCSFVFEDTLKNSLKCVLNAFLKIDYRERPRTDQALNLIINIRRTIKNNQNQKTKICYRSCFYNSNIALLFVLIKGVFFIIYRKTFLEFYIFILSLSVDFLIYSKAKKKLLLPLYSLSLFLYSLHCWF